MPDPEVSDRERSWPLLTVLFWGGTSLAPIAALLLLFADGNGLLRVAAVLALAAVVLIGLSITLRAGTGGDSGPADEALPPELLDELARLRRELRSEIAATARDTHRSVSEQLRRTQESLATARHPDPTRHPVGSAETAAPGRAQDHVPVSAASASAAPARRRPAEPGPVQGPARDESTGPGGHRPVVPAGSAGRRRSDVPEPEVSSRYGSRVTGADRYRGSTGTGHHQRDVDGADRDEPDTAGRYRPAAAPSGPTRAPRRYESDPQETRRRESSAPQPVGLVRHTETVHVTTRHTVVGGPHSVPDPDGRYEADHPGRWSAPSRQPGAGPPAGWRREQPAPAHDGRSWQGDDPHAGHGPGPGSEPYQDAGRGGGDDAYREAGRGGGDDAYRRSRHGGRPAADDEASGDRPGWGIPAPRRAGDDSAWSGSVADRSDGWRPPGASGADQPPPRVGTDQPPGWSARAGASDRWVEVHTDSHGRELRMGEQRTTTHADQRGSELRVEDRWATVRRDNPAPPADPHLRPDPRSVPPAGRHFGEPPTGGAAAVPAVPAPQPWLAEPAPTHRPTGPEPTGRRSPHHRSEEERYGYPPSDEVPWAGGAPLPDHRR